MGVTIDRNGCEHADKDGAICFGAYYEPGSFLPQQKNIEQQIRPRRLVNPKFAEIAAFNRLNSQHRGTVGERLRAVPVTVFRTKALEGFYGTTWLTIARDFAGNVYVSKTAQRWAYEGDDVVIDDAVKAHEMRDDVAQTIINRVKAH